MKFNLVFPTYFLYIVIYSLFSISWVSILTGCSSHKKDLPIIPTKSTPTTTLLNINNHTETPSPFPTQQPSPTTHIPLSTKRIILSPTQQVSRFLSLCTPLEGISLDQLDNMVSNPFSPPRPGSDDPHQGVDLSIIDPVTGFAMEGTLVEAITSGIVAAIINNRFPYGNAIIIETPLEGPVESWFRDTLLPTPVSTQDIHTILTCPQIESTNLEGQPSPPYQTQISIYLLYAHLLKPPEFKVGDLVARGSKLGLIGMSGNAINPHLHLEVRIGPSGQTFNSMAHYDTSATDIEMSNYCLWRVSGRFQLVNPMDLFSHPQ